jgi:hypothetical protein
MAANPGRLAEAGAAEGAAQARGQARMAEMNQQVADSLQRIITALEADQDPQEGAADAS